VDPTELLEDALTILRWNALNASFKADREGGEPGDQQRRDQRRLASGPVP
jgi:hypothetical protein